jgi:hypothetical protein
MRKATGLDLALGMLAFVLIYVVISTNSSITGFVIGPPATIELVGPVDGAETTQTSITFMFKYPLELDMKQCSLVLENKIVKTAFSLLSASDSRIKMDLKPGTYPWRIECIDSDDVKIESLTNTLRIITPQEAVGLQKIPGPSGYVYAFVLKDGLVLAIPDVRPGDVFRIKRDTETYLITVLRIAQDYGGGLTFTELLITPGDKRIMMNPGGSRNIDFNNDDVDDISLNLESISSKRAIFTVTYLKQEKKIDAPAADSQPKNAFTPTAGESNEKPKGQLPAWSVPRLEGNFMIILVLVITLVVLIVIVVLAKNRASKGKGYVEGMKEDALAVQAELMKGKKKPVKSGKKKKK